MPLIQLVQMLWINLWMQYKVPPIRLRVPQSKIKLRSCRSKLQAQVPAVQNQAQGPAVQIPVQGPAQIGQNVPVQPPQQPAPVQPVPAGIVVPAPQIIYQNWIG